MAGETTFKKSRKTFTEDFVRLKKKEEEMMTTETDLAREAANRIVEGNFVSQAPIDVVEIAGQMGFACMVASFNDPEVSAIIEFDSRKIIVEQRDTWQFQRFAVAHQLGHAVLNHDQKDKYPLLRKPFAELDLDPREHEANIFAIHLLIPKKMLEPIRHLSVEELAKTFNVTKLVMGYRLANA